MAARLHAEEPLKFALMPGSRLASEPATEIFPSIPTLTSVIERNTHMAPANISDLGWTPSPETTRRLALILVFTILALGILTGCTVHPTVQPSAVTVVATSTSSEPRPVLPDSLRPDLVALAKASNQVGNATVRLVTSATGPITETDLTPHRPNGDVQHAAGDANRQINEAIDHFAHAIADATADQPGLALLPLIDHASQIADTDIHVVSSGVSTTDPVSLLSLGWGFNSDKVIASVERQGQLPNLAGHRVTFHGLGVTAGTQPSLPPFARDKIEKLWVGICERAKAISCGVAHESVITEPSRAPLPVPVVPIPAAFTEGDGCPVFANLPDDRLMFCGPTSRRTSWASNVWPPRWRQSAPWSSATSCSRKLSPQRR